MPANKSRQPEAVSYDEYERLRDSGIHPTSLHSHKNYTARIRHSDPKPTREVYAFDFSSRITSIKHLGKYSLVEFVVVNFSARDNLTRGINLNGLIFIPKPLPESLDQIPYTSEQGYFVGAVEGQGNRGAVPDESSADILNDLSIEQRQLSLAH